MRQMMENKWDERFMGLCSTVASWSSCISRNIGAIAVRDKHILTTGYNGAPCNTVTCRERGYCIRRQNGIASGTRTEDCYAVHAEQNAVAQAARLGLSLDGATLYCTHQPCTTCSKLLINAGVKRVVYQHSYPNVLGVTLLR